MNELWYGPMFALIRALGAGFAACLNLLGSPHRKGWRGVERYCRVDYAVSSVGKDWVLVVAGFRYLRFQFIEIGLIGMWTSSGVAVCS